MSIDFTMPGDIPGFGDSTLPSFESQLSAIMQKILRTAYNYAMETPEKLHTYIQIGAGSASAGCLFEVGGKLYDLDTLRNAQLKSSFDASDDNKMEFFGFLAVGIGDIMNLFRGQERAIPSEIWTSIEVETVERATIVGYNVDGPASLPSVQLAVSDWKDRLEQTGSDLIGRLSVTTPSGEL